MLSQREGPITIIRDTLKTKGFTGLYSGCSALVVGNSLKAGVRFVSYDYFKSKLADAEVRFVANIRLLLTSFHDRAK